MTGKIRPDGYNPIQELGLYYLQSRHYNPTWGRFINADALVSTGQGILGNNMFAYCRNNPVKRKDISGTNDLCVTDDDDDNPFNDLAMPSGGGGSGAGANAGGSGYVYGVDLSVAQRSALTTGGIYNNGFSPYGYSTGPATPGQGSNTIPSACFVAGTLVQGEDGAVPIEDIKAGDLVWAWDEETGNVALKRVAETYINQSDELIHIFVNGEEIVTTPTHPFYSPVKGWTAACKLRAGDILVTVNGEYVVVEKIQHEILEAPITVYNFQVEGYHTYYVSNSGVLVHNSCPKGPDKKQAKEIAKSLGYSKVQGVFSHGQAIFRNNDAIKTLRFISVDVDSHNGGFWKAASSIDNLRHKSTRSGTYTWDLTERIGD